MNNNDKIKEIVRQTVKETLVSVGISAHEPNEMQADFIYIRKMREGADFISKKIRASVIAVLIPSFIYVLWESLKHIFTK